MILSKGLINDVMDHYEKMKNHNCVVKPSLPILFFGDLESFVRQEKKVVTVALNPSDKEFRSHPNEDYSFFRFPQYQSSKETLVKSLNNYFKYKPYGKWFKNSFEDFLNGLECSYFPENPLDKVLHTDICSPLATDPTWSSLSEYERSLLVHDGFEFWKRLIVEIKPNLIIISCAKKHLYQLRLVSKEIIHTLKHTKNGVPRSHHYMLEKYKIAIGGYQTNLVYGRAAQMPFSLISKADKKKMGEMCLKTFF